ncbi:MAG: SEC-C metal-binding domain-containing protein, partial [Burkholderiales bacterium]
STDLSSTTLGMIEAVITQIFDTYIPPKTMEEMWDTNNLVKILKDEFLLEYDINAKLHRSPNMAEGDIKAEVIALAKESYQHKMHTFARKVAADVNQFINEVIGSTRQSWKLDALDGFCWQNGIALPNSTFVEYANLHPELSREEMITYFNQVVGDVGNYQVLRFERGILLQHIDYHWREHLTQLEQLRQGIHLRGYAQKDPKQEYKHESFNLFSHMLDNIKRDAAKMLLTVVIQGLEDIPTENSDSHVDEGGQKLVHAESVSLLTKQPAAISRNSSCPCGSGKKYKHCCGKLV